MPAEQVVGRFAPSPSGPLHMGSLVAAVGSYCMARRSGGKWLLRMEDLDPPRVVAGAADEILFALDALGLLWDEEIIWQSRRAEAYAAAMEVLHERNLVFGCACTRREIQIRTGLDEEGSVYPGTCRHGLPEGRMARAVRLRVPDETVSFVDGVYGLQSQLLSREVGDFVLHRADGLYAYQLAVVVDDADSGVNQVVRGADLLSSTPRQIFLHACLGSRVLEYAHLPLVVDGYGQKLSKQQGAAAIDYAHHGPALISTALDFLGQKLPEDLLAAPVEEQLLWATGHFVLGQVPDALAGLTAGWIGA